MNPEMEPARIQLVLVIVGLVFVVIIARLIRRGKLREEYSFLWFLSSLILLLFAVWRDGLDIVAKFLGVYYAPSLLFIGAILAILIFLIHISVVISKLQSQTKVLAQEIALLKTEGRK